MPSETSIPVAALKGRGAATRIAHRFSKDARDAFDDGWGTLQEQGATAGAPLQTEVIFEDAKSAIVQQQSPDIYFEQSINPYRGCEHVMRQWYCSECNPVCQQCFPTANSFDNSSLSRLLQRSGSCDVDAAPLCTGASSRPSSRSSMTR